MSPRLLTVIMSLALCWNTADASTLPYHLSWSGSNNRDTMTGTFSGTDTAPNLILSSKDNEFSSFSVTFRKVADNSVVAVYALADLLLASGNFNVDISNPYKPVVLQNGNATATGPTLWGFSIGNNTNGSLKTTNGVLAYTDTNSGSPLPLTDSGGRLTVAEVPGPATPWLLLGGLAALAAMRRRS